MFLEVLRKGKMQKKRSPSATSLYETAVQATLHSVLGEIGVNPLTPQWELTLTAEDIARVGARLGQLSEANELPVPSRPVLPTHTAGVPVLRRLAQVQRYLEQFGYNHTAVNSYFNVNKQRPLSRIADTAREVFARALPIKCLEAVFCALLLTAGLPGVDRTPLSFRSVVAGVREFKHIVLAVRVVTDAGLRWGGVGMSRKATLAWKPPLYESLADLVAEYVRCYEEAWHRVISVKIGLPVTHDMNSSEFVCWDGVVVHLREGNWEQVAKPEINKHAKDMFKLASVWSQAAASAGAVAASSSSFSSPGGSAAATPRKTPTRPPRTSTPLSPRSMRIERKGIKRAMTAIGGSRRPREKEADHEEEDEGEDQEADKRPPKEDDLSKFLAV
jgi:hypothetical protein